VKYLLIINFVVFVVQIVADGPGVGRMSSLLGVTVGSFYQLWRYITFQFLHSTGDLWHIAWNMLGLYFLGTPLERRYGSRRFVKFYLSCGVAAGIAFVVIGALGDLPRNMPIIGASGGVYGVVLAAAVFLPHFRLIILFFPVPIRLAALLIFGRMILLVLLALRAGRTDAAMSDVAHLGGAAAAAFWIWVLPRIRTGKRRVREKTNAGAWRRKMAKQEDLQRDIDRILQKIHEHGLNSLSRSERKTLQDATRKQQKQDRDIYRL